MKNNDRNKKVATSAYKEYAEQDLLAEAMVIYEETLEYDYSKEQD